jgi:hypothetical protein
MKIYGKNKSYLGVNKDLKPVFEFEKITGSFFKKMFIKYKIKYKLM